MPHTLLCLTLLLSAVSQAPPATPASPEEAPPLDQQVERAARDYRIRLYNNFHRDRAEYDRRREAGDKLLAKWRALQQPEDQRADVVAWFEAGQRASTVAGAPLQDLPEIMSKTLEAVVVTEPVAPAAEPPALTGIHVGPELPAAPAPAKSEPVNALLTSAPQPTAPAEPAPSAPASDLQPPTVVAPGATAPGLPTADPPAPVVSDPRASAEPAPLAPPETNN